MTTVWQQCGGFVATLENLSNWHIDNAHAAGMRWFAPVIYQDDASGPRNRALLPEKMEYAKGKMQVGGWFNCFGGAPQVDAVRIHELVVTYKLKFGIIDCEEAYKRENAPLLSELMKYIRLYMPHLHFAVSSFGFADRAMIWRDLFRYQFRFLPQWYYLYDGKYSPDWCMKDLKENGRFDGNIMGGIPLSYVHGTLSLLEGHELSEGVRRLRSAHAYGFTKGFSVYTLENCNTDHFNTIASARDLFATA